jgi:hypothetical protein
MGIDLPDKNAFDDCQARVAGVRGNTGVRDQSQSGFRDSGPLTVLRSGGLGNPDVCFFGKGSGVL